ncbi:oxidoreductase, partial [Rhodospirillaceae bacterium KN72]|nr:oxidoreductase [Pacificispira spongiicola]
ASAIDLIDTSGGTYFPGAKAASDGRAKGAYFRDFTRAAKRRTKKPIMLTGGIKTWEEAADILSDNSADMIGLARSLVIDPSLPKSWAQSPPRNPVFPRFDNPPDGGITAWYTMHLTQIAEDRDAEPPMDIPDAIDAYDSRDKDRIPLWRARFGN